MEQTAFISEGRINILGAGDAKPTALVCQTADKYRQREREIRLKNEWKHKGMGAMFTGSYEPDDALDIKLPVTGLAKFEGRLVFAINFENGGGIYFKSVDEKDPETPVLVNTKDKFFELDVNPSGRIAVSAAENYLERHIAVLKTDNTHMQTLTEGECADCNPKWSLKNENVLYYDSAGIGYDRHGRFAGFGPRSVCRLDITTGQLDEVLANNDYDYFSPFEDSNGDLYFIRRPYDPKSGGMSAADYAAAPGKLLRAFGGWLDFFTRRYSGESLKTSGANPAKTNPKSPEQLFVDGNLLEADKNMKLNAQSGDQNPGYAPQTWELRKKTPFGEETVLLKSVISYRATNNGIVHSNGKYVVSHSAVAAHLAAKLC